MDRISKRVILAWAVAALFAQSYLVSSAWPGVITVVTLLFFGGTAAALIDRRLVGLALVPAYVAPILLVLGIGRYHTTLASPIVLAPLLGAMIPEGLRSGWRLPTQWRASLACWMGVVCVTVPLVVARTADFHFELLSRGRSPFEALGGFPLVTAAWVVHSGLLLVAGVLWLDWLRARDRAYVERFVVAPLAVGAFVLVVVLLWQMFIDITFLNATVYAGLKRASGTLMDANAAGAVAAWWIGAAFFFAASVSGLRRVLCLAAVPVVWAAVWATGSRTAFGLAAFSTVVGGLSMIGRGAGIGGRLTTRRTLTQLAAVAVIFMIGVALIAQMPVAASGPLARLRAMLPTRDLAGVQAVAKELWNRNGYGAVAGRIINAYPAFGVGIGTFHDIATEYAPKLPPDNAQNWFRHQIAETGVIGSLGWIALFTSVALWLLRRPASPETRRARPLFGALAGFTAISLLGMPGQDVVVALTLWTFAAWYLHVAGWPPDMAASGSTPRSVMSGRTAWALALLIVATSGIGTYVAAMGRLRTPARIQRMGGDYIYGFSWPEADGQGSEFRWARSRATAIVATSSRSLELTLRTNRPDLTAQPLRVRAWVDGRRVIDGELTSSSNTIVQTVNIPAGEPRALIDIWADRSITAPPPDGRELAVMVRWRFVAPSALTSPSQ